MESKKRHGSIKSVKEGRQIFGMRDYGKRDDSSGPEICYKFSRPTGDGALTRGEKANYLMGKRADGNEWYLRR